eukprot:Plantae.Rhodophyta-Hildenbrandia_rubra.ctg22189.p1 GENE.Plantae.Rhodophyta-Hildenbrandia_rubra.ctg22189~~Plantae.Rhodophyta-Hildenbrandia_rubra.ctg22189.p1  ORF type:complete len:441 (+),score=135.67 Plantae.Rhodophyta-Hildenbrandia_rubra.ctg22189:70-1392(+)
MACFLHSLPPTSLRSTFLSPLRCQIRSSPALYRVSRPHRSRILASVEMSPEAKSVISADENDVLLGEMRYGEPDALPGIVEANIAKLRKEGEYSFWTHVDSKIDEEEDLQEKETLGILKDAVRDLVDQIGDSLEKDGVVGKDEPLVTLKERVKDGTGYVDLLNEFLEDGEEDLAVRVEQGYDKIDMQFLTVLEEEERKRSGNEREAVKKLKEEVVRVMARRMNLAGERVKNVFAAKGMVAMTAEMEKLGREGGIDDAFMLMLKANLDQAKKAKAEKFVTVLEEVVKRASAIKDRELSPEITLIRKLLRTEDEDARKRIIVEALKPRKKVMLVGGEMSSGVKTDGKLFVAALRKLIQEFGNVQEGFVEKLSKIGEESEAVARELFKLEGKDVNELQNEAFHKRSVSVWELERLELQETIEGRKAPWEHAQPAGFEDGKRAL